MGALDGNQSLKRVCFREGAHSDPRKFTSDYYISEEKVDQFKYDVKPRPSPSQKKVVCYILLPLSCHFDVSLMSA
jgi:Kyakuja-Dileera-Zisupton transposase